MAAFIHQCLRGFVVFADLIQLDTDNVGLPEVCAKSALSVVYVDHAKTSTRVGQHLYCQSTGQIAPGGPRGYLPFSWPFSECSFMTVRAATSFARLP